MDIKNICGNKMRQMIYNINTNRFTTQSPYVQNAQGQLVYTQDQLDMRRKAEILQYASSNQNSKQNGTTQKQKWAQTVRNTSISSNRACPNTDLMPMPTSSSGIPGQIRYLIRDTTVPLYNYKQNTDPYAVTTVEDNALWKSFSNNNILCQNDVSTKLFSLYITNKIEDKQNSFTFSTPYAFYVQGTTTTSNNSSRIKDISLNINSVEATILYNNIATNIATVVSTTNNSVLYDISMNTIQNKSYSFYCYAGILTIAIPVLYTEPGYVYDVNLSFNMTLTPPNFVYNDTFTRNIAILCNLEKEDVLSSQFAILQPASILTPLPPFRPYQLVDT